MAERFLPVGIDRHPFEIREEIGEGRRYFDASAWLGNKTAISADPGGMSGNDAARTGVRTRQFVYS